jgi:hypothetical protein
VVTADDPAAWSDGEVQGGLLDLSPSARVAAFERLTDNDSRLVILCGQRQASRVHREASIARSTLETRVAVIPLPGGPLAQYAMARIADHTLAIAGRPSTLIVSLLPDLATRLVDIGLLGSVSALDIQGIKLRHHLASYLPGSRLFAARLTPTPFVTRIRRDRLPGAAAEAFEPADFGAGGARLLIAGPRPLPGVLERQLDVAGAVQPVEAALDLPGFWRDERATELVVVPANPAGWVVQQVPGPAGAPCNWCGEFLAASAGACMFCGNTPR